MQEVADKDYVRPTDDALDAAKQTAKEKRLSAPNAISTYKFSRSALLMLTQELLARDVLSSEKIADLVRDAVLESWVKKGVEYHEQHGHDRCLFCNQSMPQERWISLQKHFDEESKTLSNEIADLIKKLTEEVATVKAIPELDKRQYYAIYESKVEELNATLVEVKKEYCRGLESAIAELKERQAAISSMRNYTVPEDCTEKIENVLLAQKSIRETMTDYTLNLEKEKEKAHKLLRLNRVYEAESTYNFLARKEKMVQLGSERSALEEKVKVQSDLIANKLKDIEELQKSLRDEGRAAQLINQFLAFQEVNALRLQVENIPAVDSVPRTTFKIYRGASPAYNLSEGERSIIAFCYFLAKLKSESLRPIVVIDDPISSLDSNHIYYVYSLIRGILLKESLSSQLIILTHNLDFLKYLKRLNISSENRSNAWFIVENLGDKAEIRPMPKHLKEFITEFNYLFERIYNCAVAEFADDGYAEKVYGFGNAARKFLELYLYFKFPEGDSDKTLAKNEHMKEVFGDVVASFMIDRVLNEGSHLVGRLERAAVPVDQAEIKSVAREILKVVKNTDASQYGALLRSIGKAQSDPIGD